MLVFKAHRLVYRSTQGLRVIKTEKKKLERKLARDHRFGEAESAWVKAGRAQAPRQVCSMHRL